MPTYQALDWKALSSEAASAVSALSEDVIRHGGTRPYVVNVQTLSEHILTHPDLYPGITGGNRPNMTPKGIRTRCTYALSILEWKRWDGRSSNGRGAKFVIPWASEDKSKVVISDA